MPRTLFDEELARLHADLAEMGRRVDALMQDAIRCLKSMDRPLARRIVPGTPRSTPWKRPSSTAV